MFQLLIKVSIFVFLAIASSSSARTSSPGSKPTSPKALSDLKEAITKGLGFEADDVKISGFDVRDALVGHSVAYEFDVEIGNKVMPLKLLEDVNRWEYVDLPIFRMEDPKVSGKELVDRNKVDGGGLPVLEPFQLAGPMELWIQDAKDMRISLPHDVDAGVLKKVILAEGAVVTVKGARSVNLRHPVELPLPLNRTNNGFASGIVSLAERLRQVSLIEGAPLLSLRIVGPTSITSPTSSTNSPVHRLKLKRLAPGLVELSSPSKPKATTTTDLTPVNLQDATSLLTPTQFTTMWPLTSINASNSNLLGFEALLSSVLGPKASKKGSFKLLKADVSAQTYMKIGFQVEKKLKEADGIDLTGFPSWRTKPENVRMHFEVLAKVDGDEIYPERIIQVNPFLIEDTAPQSVLTGNITMSTVPIFHPPPDPFTL